MRVIRGDGGDSYYLTSGKEFEAHQGVVGIDDNGDLFTGYDHILFKPEYTNLEMIEICEWAIERWTALKKRLEGVKE